MTQPLWTPSQDRIDAANLTRFMAAARARSGRAIPDFSALYEWSVADSERFWDLLWDFCGVVAETKGGRVLADGDRMPGAKFFPDARLNYAENLLRRTGAEAAITFWGEDAVKRTMSFDELRSMVSSLQQALRDAGVGEGDRVAGWMPNMPETVAAMLATVSIGAVWSSSSPDFGVKGVVDRFGQIDPKVLFLPDGYYYNGKTHDCLERARDIVGQLPSLHRVVVVPYVNDGSDVASLGDKAVVLGDFMAGFPPAELTFARMPFNHPLYIMFSSGTTGVPKCIVHGAGGTLLQHLKEHVLHTDVKRGDQVFYFTTCGWMMWNWLVSALAAEGSVLLYDGSPFHPSGDILFDFADATGMAVFGTSAKYIDALNKAGLEPKKTHDLKTVRVMCSTGSPLAPEGFDYVYRSIKSDICLSSISGGTDIVSCFALGNPIGPVWRGELQTRGLGMAVEVYDDDGRPTRGEKGELVCVKPFPCMPIGFWNDDDGAKYHGAYFDEYPNIWRHGDYVELTEHDGMIVHGRSDATLNPGGVRIGTAEIYRQVEQLDEVEEGLVIGQDWDNDVRVVLFVRLREGGTLDEDLATRIKAQIRRNTTPRHVPAKILQVADIPRTKSGKIVELAVRNVVHGRPVRNVEALANPEALDHFRDRAELRDA